MKVGRVRSWWIAMCSAWVTLKYSLIVLFASLIGKLSRARGDRYAHQWAEAVVNVVKLSYSVFNSYHVQFKPNQAYILMSNHCSHYDIPLIFMVFPHESIRMIAKKELFRVPVWGKAMSASEFISLDRNNPRQAIKDLHFAKEKMESGIIPWIAPEGTRSLTGELGEFKQGGFMLASKTKAVIIPIGIYGSARVLPAKTCQFSIGEHVQIVIGEPIDSSKYVNNRRLLMTEVEERIRALVKEGEKESKAKVR